MDDSTEQLVASLPAARRYEAEDDWLIAYSTKRATSPPAYAGKFVVLAYRPRRVRGQVVGWTVEYQRAFRRRKDAKARAQTLLLRHSPEAAAKGVTLA